MGTIPLVKHLGGNWGKETLKGATKQPVCKAPFIKWQPGKWSLDYYSNIMESTEANDQLPARLKERAAVLLFHEIRRQDTSFHSLVYRSTKREPLIRLISICQNVKSPFIVIMQSIISFSASFLTKYI